MVRILNFRCRDWTMGLKWGFTKTEICLVTKLSKAALGKSGLLGL